MKLRDIIAEAHPELKEKYNSKQYELDNELIYLKISFDKSQLEMSQLAEIDFDTYLSMEWTDLTVSVVDYARIIKRIEDKLKNK